jgi:hypothetical protein
LKPRRKYWFALLRHDHTRHELEYFVRPQRETVCDQLRGDRAFAGGVGRADAVVVMADDTHDVGRCGDICGRLWRDDWAGVGQDVHEGAQRPGASGDQFFFMLDLKRQSRALPCGRDRTTHVSIRALPVGPVSGLVRRTGSPSHAGGTVAFGDSLSSWTTLAYRCGGSTPWYASVAGATMCFPFDRAREYGRGTRRGHYTGLERR